MSYSLSRVRFNEPLSSSGMFRLSGVMSQYDVGEAQFYYSTSAGSFIIHLLNHQTGNASPHHPSSTEPLIHMSILKPNHPHGHSLGLSSVHQWSCLENCVIRISTRRPQILKLIPHSKT
jgi:hypothetical protein